MASHLAYSIPIKDRKKTLMRIPESHSLYVSPQSCARRQAIRAHKNGEADRSSFLQLTQSDLVSGAYEGQVADAVRELLDILPQCPRVMQIFVNCVDDFLGTDNDALLDDLRERFPDVRFSLSHINPIAVDLETEPMKKMQSGLYSLLENPPVRDAGVTVVGGFVPLPADCELHRALAAVGAGPVRHVTACETFDEYLQLAQSSTVLSAGGMGDAMAEAFGERFGMQRIVWHPTYALDQVDDRYRELSALLGAAGGDCDQPAGEASGTATCDAMAAVIAPARAAAASAVRRALAVAKDVPIAVDSSATFVPYNLAHELLDYGFDVRVCFAFHMKGGDGAAAQRLREDYPDVRIVNESAGEALRAGSFATAAADARAGESSEDDGGDACGGDARACGGESGEGIGVRDGDSGSGRPWLAIGSEAAFFTGASCVLDIYHDEGYFGYQGIERLMRELADAIEAAGDDACGEDDGMRVDGAACAGRPDEAGACGACAPVDPFAAGKGGT